MKAVSNTSPFVWLNKAGYLELPSKIYNQIYSTPGIVQELLTFPQLPTGFVEATVTIPDRIKENPPYFEKLVRRWHRRNFQRQIEVTDVEVLVAYKLFVKDAQEMLFANKDAERRFGKYGPVRDIVDLYSPAELQSLFTREDTAHYLTSLERIGYRVGYIAEVKKKLSL